MIEQASSFLPLFCRKWVSAYQQLKGTNEQFGVIQELEHRHAGKYIVLKNKEYFKKRTTNSLQIAFRSKKIDLSFQQQGFNFKKIDKSQSLLQISQVGGSFSIVTASTVPSIPTSQLIINGCPIALYHSLFVPFLSEGLPQILKQPILSALLSLSACFPGFKIGYNSQGAGSTVNHFHAQLMQLSHILPNNRFYFEDIPSRQLIHYSEQKTTISFFLENSAIYLRVSCQQLQLGSQRTFVSASVMKIIDLLLKQSVPHNIIITDPSNLYIVVRNFARPERRYGWLEYSGLFIACLPEEYEQTEAYFLDSFNLFLGLDLEGLLDKIKLALS